MNLKIFTPSLFLLILLDYISKIWSYIYFQNEVIIIPSLLSLEYAQNSGIAFSIPLTWIALKVITLILIFWIFWYYWKEERHKKSLTLDISFLLIFAGALGNAWERIFQWYVTDFISVQYFSIFNFADSYITLWACWIIYYYWKHKT